MIYDAINSCRHHKHHHRRHRQHHRGGGGGHHHHKKHHKRRHQQQQRHHRDYDYYEEEAEDDNNSVLTGLTQEQRQEVLGVLENNFLSSFGLKPPSGSATQELPFDDPSQLFQHVSGLPDV